MLSELIEKCNAFMEKYGDRRVMVDTDGMEYICHHVEISSIDMILSDESIEEDPLIISEPPFDAVIINLDDRVKRIPYQYK